MTPRAFGQLHGQYRDRLYANVMGFVGNTAEADDVTASAWATAFRERKRFRRESSFFTWIYRIACNEATAVLRRKRTISLDAIEGPEPEALVEPDLLDQRLDRSECCRRLRQALKRLPAKNRRLLVDHFVRRIPVRELGRRHRIPVGTVLSRIFNAKQRLRYAYDTETIKSSWRIP